MNGNRLTSSVILVLAVLLLTGCGRNFFRDDPPQETIKSAPVARGQQYKAAVMLTRAPNTPLGRRLGDRYLETLVQAIGHENGRISLLTPGESEFPSFMATLANAVYGGDTLASMAPGRQQGFQGVILAAITNIKGHTRNWGFFWFSRTLYYVSFSLTIDLYDPFTGAKIVSRLKETSIRVDSFEYESFQDGNIDFLEELEEELVETAEAFGELVAEKLTAQPWKASVVGSENGYIQLAVDSGAALEPDQKLAVYEARRVVQNQYGQQFIVPGIKLAEARITRIGHGVIEATLEDSADIRPGDLAIATP